MGPPVREAARTSQAPAPHRAEDGVMLSPDHTYRGHALRLVEWGLAVFPLKPRDKAPATRHGFKEATSDPRIVDGWWQGWPDLNIGIATGKASGVWVLDVDGETGEASLAAL